VKYVAPQFEADAFHCLHCSCYAHQHWTGLRAGLRADTWIEGLRMSRCSHCSKYTLWVDERIVYPTATAAPLAHEAMPSELQRDYQEARDVVELSPRASAALLRLCIQRLCVYLHQPGKNLNDDIGALVKAGLPAGVRDALDVVRVVGNNAVHPGEMDLQDDKETALALFDLVNMVVDKMIAEPQRMNDLLGRLPQSAREARDQRDAKH